MKTDLFRPPHGHMGWTQYMILKRRYKIIMWGMSLDDYLSLLSNQGLQERMVQLYPDEASARRRCPNIRRGWISS